MSLDDRLAKSGYDLSPPQKGIQQQIPQNLLFAAQLTTLSASPSHSHAHSCVQTMW